ncbi:ATP phosphoribosyltransferase regulatory subunit [Campylobacter sp. FMV-PI01]|uniref:ATP phosphoribosyltransferase regulatory subunit n=2 Tax=Campylobacter portucalensis TaxID=2608384 RepID=A0A6L5WIR4_9BACT|nr:ATP phosphoribosyltransferase regulatory subunit [Campylobacter portucalensis]
MIRADLEHEIPDGSRLYFAKSADLKREIENSLANTLKKYDFTEIVTPYFSYHQQLSVSSSEILSFSDSTNHTISLRADSTVDVVRIVLRRIKDRNLKRIFYIQPVFKYPNSEFYQIGAEMIAEPNLNVGLEICLKFFEEFNIKSSLQISNIEIPKIICEILDISIDVFEKGDLSEILSTKHKWLRDLARVGSMDDLKKIINLVPQDLKKPLQDVLNLALKSGVKDSKFALLYYSKMRYYDSLFFRFLSGNSVLCSGGNYEIDSLKSCGFAVMSDCVIENILKIKEGYE